MYPPSLGLTFTGLQTPGFCHVRLDHPGLRWTGVDPEGLGHAWHRPLPGIVPLEGGGTPT